MENFSDYINESESSKSVGVFFGKLFQSRDITHLNHLFTKSHEDHVALNEYYDGLLESIDALVECYQGNNEIISIEIPSSTSDEFDSIDHLNKLKEYIDSTRESISDTAEFNNTLDDILSLISSTLYKLKNLK